MKAIMMALAIGIISILGWFYIESTAGIPPTMAHLMKTNVYRVTNSIVQENHRNTGTAVWLDSRYSLTNCHVVQQFKLEEHKEGEVFKVSYPDMQVYSHDGEYRFEVEVLGCSVEYDLALLYSWWPNHNVKDISVNWMTPRFGSIAYSAGYGLDKTLQPKTGYFGAAQQRDGYARRGITMGVAPGDSGSPVFDRRGDLRALVSATAGVSTKEGITVPIGDIAQAIPGFMINQFIRETKEIQEGLDAAAALKESNDG